MLSKKLCSERACVSPCVCRLVDGGRYLSVIGSVWKKESVWTNGNMLFCFHFLNRKTRATCLDSNRSMLHLSLFIVILHSDKIKRANFFQWQISQFRFYIHGSGDLLQKHLFSELSVHEQKREPDFKLPLGVPYGHFFLAKIYFKYGLNKS